MIPAAQAAIPFAIVMLSTATRSGGQHFNRGLAMFLR